MTQDRDFKKVVRTRMTKTGERYAAARAQLRTDAPQQYSFENLSADAQRALARAADKAARDGARHIGTDHLLVAVVGEWRIPGSARAQNPLPLTGYVRALQKAVADLDAEPEPAAPGVAGEGLSLSSPARGALERAFYEARSMSSREVGTEHLLLGILAVPTSKGARALGQVNVEILGTKGRSSAQGMRAWHVSGRVPDYSDELADLLARAHARARESGAPRVEIEDLLAVLEGGPATPE